MSDKPTPPTKEPPVIEARLDKKLGQILIELKFITAEQLAATILEQAQVNTQSKRFFKLGELLLFKNLITLEQLHIALRRQTSKALKSRNMVKELQNKAAAGSLTVDRLRESSNKAKDKQEQSGLKSLLNFLTKKR